MHHFRLPLFVEYSLDFVSSTTRMSFRNVAEFRPSAAYVETARLPYELLSVNTLKRQIEKTERETENLRRDIENLRQELRQAALQRIREQQLDAEKEIGTIVVIAVVVVVGGGGGGVVRIFFRLG
jgi:hypothetical protein